MPSLWMTQQCGSCDKTKEMAIHFGRTGAAIAPVPIDNNVLEPVTSFKLLGCIVNNQLSWQDHVDCIYTPRPAGGRTFCAYSERPGLSHMTLSESSPLQLAPFWNMHVRLGTPDSLGNSRKSLNPFNGGLCALLPQTCHTGKR